MELQETQVPLTFSLFLRLFVTGSVDSFSLFLSFGFSLIDLAALPPLIPAFYFVYRHYFLLLFFAARIPRLGILFSFIKHFPAFLHLAGCGHPLHGVISFSSLF